jgi:hypothetical protein
MGGKDGKRETDSREERKKAERELGLVRETGERGQNLMGNDKRGEGKRGREDEWNMIECGDPRVYSCSDLSV